MATLLLIVICIIFIGLGIPDSAIGAAWPSIFNDLNLPVSYANFITMIIALFTCVASFFSAKLIIKFGTSVITAFSTLLTAIALIGFSVSPNIVWLSVSAIPAGFGAGCIDAALNNYVAVHYKSSHMSFLHCFYGVGVAVTPFILSFTLKNENWRLGYKTIFFIQIFITLIAFISLPLWKKVKTIEKGEDFTPKTLKYKEIFSIPAERIAIFAFFASVGLEFSCGTWITSYLVECENAPANISAFFLTFYYIGITLGRFLSGIITKKVKNQKLLIYCAFIVGIAIVLLFLPIPYIAKGIALFMIGSGNGPVFPNLTYLTPVNFGKDISQSLIGAQMLFCNLAILIIPPIFGVLAQFIGIKIFPIYILLLFVLYAITLFIYLKRTNVAKK